MGAISLAHFICISEERTGNIAKRRLLVKPYGVFSETLRLLNALNSEDRGLKVRFSLATIAFERESAQMSQILSSQGKTHLQTLSSLFSAFSNLKESPFSRDFRDSRDFS